MKANDRKYIRKELSPETEREIFNDYLFGKSRYKITKEYKIPDSKVCEIIKNSLQMSESILETNINPHK